MHATRRRHDSVRHHSPGARRRIAGSRASIVSAATHANQTILSSALSERNIPQVTIGTVNGTSRASSVSATYRSATLVVSRPLLRSVAEIAFETSSGGAPRQLGMSINVHAEAA